MLLTELLSRKCLTLTPKIIHFLLLVRNCETWVKQEIPHLPTMDVTVLLQSFHWFEYAAYLQCAPTDLRHHACGCGR
jgi:hypothetical protein